ncbi:MAG TPA: uroporphyrinogen-III synthase [Jatrophihabitans sp.]|jgi:uroporphyrinogen-III synthase
MEPLAGYTVAITAARRSQEFGSALERRGATVVYAPAVRIIPLADDAHLHETTRRCLSKGVDIVVATTGIGFRGWIEAAEAWGLAEELLSRLERAELIARGPKVRGALRAAGLTEAWAPESESMIEVLDQLLDRPLHGKRIAVQLHGEPLAWFLDAIRNTGAEVIDVPVYRSVLPDDSGPVHKLLGCIAARQVDAVAFTSAAASANFLSLIHPGSEAEIRRAFNGDVLAACVGPVTAAPLVAHGIPAVQPDRYRLGALIKEIAEELPRRRNRRVTTAGRSIEIRGQAVVLDGELVPLGGSAIALLRKLAEQPGRVVGRVDLLGALPGGGSDGHAVEVAIGRLRTSLADPRIIETVVKRGYRLHAEAMERSATGPGQ